MNVPKYRCLAVRERCWYVDNDAYRMELTRYDVIKTMRSCANMSVKEHLICL